MSTDDDLLALRRDLKALLDRAEGKMPPRPGSTPAAPKRSPWPAVALQPAPSAPADAAPAPPTTEPAPPPATTKIEDNRRRRDKAKPAPVTDDASPFAPPATAPTVDDDASITTPVAPPDPTPAVEAPPVDDHDANDFVSAEDSAAARTFFAGEPGDTMALGAIHDLPVAGPAGDRRGAAPPSGTGSRRPSFVVLLLLGILGLAVSVLVALLLSSGDDASPDDARSTSVSLNSNGLGVASTTSTSSTTTSSTTSTTLLITTTTATTVVEPTTTATTRPPTATTARPPVVTLPPTTATTAPPPTTTDTTLPPTTTSSSLVWQDPDL